MLAQTESDLFDGIAEDMVRIAKEKRMKPEVVLDTILEELQILRDMSPEEITALRERFMEYRLNLLANKTLQISERKRRSHADEHTGEVFVDKAVISQPLPPVPYRHSNGEGFDAHERQLPVGDR